MSGIPEWSIASSKNPGKREFAFKYLTSDSVLLDIYGYDNSTGFLEGYTSHVATPVCEDQLCYDAELDFYWDLLGNFSYFSLDSSKPLTKHDHVPFSDSDYEKLRNILLTKSPSFIHLRRSELIIKPNNGDFPELDGITGATVKEVKEDMVAGAIYTCYTLWHIANGGMNFQIQEFTKQVLDADLIRQFLISEQVEAHYFLIENIDLKYFELFLNEIMELADEFDPYYIGRMIERIPDHLFENVIVQEFFLRHFHRLEYSSQKELISKLEADITLSKSTLEFLIDNIQAQNSARNDQIIRIVCKNADSDKSDILKKMFDILQNRQITVSPGSYELLMSLGQNYKSLKDEVRRFKRTNK